MKNRRILLILLCGILALGMFSFTGCGKDTEPNDSSDNGAVTEQEYRVALFFANEEYVVTGDESLEKFKVYEKEITSKPAEVYLDALEALRTEPEAGYNTMLYEQIKFNEVYLEGETVYVDMNSDGLSGSSLDESFLISQIVDTLINSFDEVKQVQFLIDGEVPETLMGHVDTQSPFTNDTFTN